MNNDHLSAWEQEEYVLEQRTPQMLRHLTECAVCRAAVERLEEGLAGFRTAAMQWSSECLSAHPPRQQVFSRRRVPATALRWAIAAMIPLVLLILALIPFHISSPPDHPAAQISDDALLDQVDEQVSVEVPSSMESLTHLVTTGSSSGAVTSARGSKHIVQDN
jgi:hypothetical protein